MNLYNLLVVEDDEVDRMNILRAFQKSNFTNKVDVCRDGVEALEYIASLPKNTPLLILLDISMPRMNGLEFLKKLREDPEWSKTPVVILTTSEENSDLTEAYKLNVAGYLVKPIEFLDFVKIMVILGKYWSLSHLPNGATI